MNEQVGEAWGRRISRIRRLRRCRSTERFATFFEITTAIPPFSGTVRAVTEKCALTARFPAAAFWNSSRDSRSFFGTMLDGELCATLAASTKEKLATCGSCRTCAEPVSSGSLPLLWLIRALWHNPQDSTRLTLNEQENRRFRSLSTVPVYLASPRVHVIPFPS